MLKCACLFYFNIVGEVINHLNLKSMGAKKNFVIDTNVILHDYNCLKNFQENDVYLAIVVLEELDKFKLTG